MRAMDDFVERGLVIDEDNPVSLSDLLVPEEPAAPAPATGDAETPQPPATPS
jgi:hypothetical protein